MSTFSHLIRIVTCLSVYLLTVPALTYANPVPDTNSEDLRLRVILENALPRSDGSAPSLILNLQKRAGNWQRVGASAGNYNQHDHSGYMLSAGIEENQMTLEIMLMIRGDAWHPGGRYFLNLTMKKMAEGFLVGSFQGEFRGNEVSGRAYGDIMIGDSPRDAPETRERPRLLFRRADLPEIRRKAQTPFGQLALEKLEDGVVASAFRYALTGDPSYAEDARQRLVELMKDRDHGPNNALSRYWSWRLEQASLAFDLCADAWDEEFRSEVAEYLYTMGNLLLYNRGVLSNRINWGHGGPHGPAIHFAAGLAGLALAGEPGPQPSRPPTPYLLSPEKGLVRADEHFQPGEGVPLFDFVSDTMPRDWIYVGAFPEREEPLGTHQARGGVRPAVGDTLGDGDQAITWRSVEESKLLYTGPHSGQRTVVELTGPSGVVIRSQSYYFTALRNDRPRWVRADTGHGGVNMYISGVHVRNQDIIKLDKGMHAWLFNGPIGDVNPWAKAFAQPRLIEIDESELEVHRERLKESYRWSLADWQEDVRQWELNDRADVRYLRFADAVQHVMDMAFTETLGRGGFLAGGRQMVALDGPNRYAFALRNATGRIPGFFAEASDYLPRTLLVHPHRQDGQLIGQEITGLPGFKTSWPEVDRSLAAEHFAALFPLVREEWQPALLWAWHEHTGGSLDSREAMEKILTVPARPYPMVRPYGSFNIHPLIALINYPLEMDPRKPEGILPLSWQAPDFGFYGFRNNWEGDDSTFITQFFAATHEEGAGTLRVMGLGKVWSHGMDGAVPGNRFAENVVQLPNHRIHSRARGKVIDHLAGPDGSGALSLDLNDVYAKPRSNDAGRLHPPFESYGRVRQPENFLPSGITGSRAMAVDYSGRSGVPALIVLVDVITGADQPVWSWQLASESEGFMQEILEARGEGGDAIAMENFQKAFNGQLLLAESEPVEDARITLHPDGFTFTQDGASMRATFVTADLPTVEMARRKEYYRTNIEVVRRNISTGLFAPGKDFFFTILTFQEGEAPEVKIIAGQGLDSVVRVGDQTIRFDGQRIILEP